jgi:hypothetical protein
MISQKVDRRDGIITLICLVSVTMNRPPDEACQCGPPVEETRGAFTGAVIGKKVETGGIVPRFTHTYPKNLDEVEQRNQWDK